MSESLPGGSRTAARRSRRGIVVRRRDIESRPAPVGGGFAEVAYTRLPLPRALTRALGTFCVNTSDRVVSITYDDGPHPEHTPRLLDLLAARGETATFFALARQVRAHPEIARRILAEGHELALHGQDHRSLLTMGDAEAVRYVRDAKDEVESIVSAPLVSFRPPYGAHTVRQAHGIAGLGMDVLIWSGDAFDWVDDEEERIAERALSTIFPGSMLLLHDDRGDPETLAPDEVFPAFDRARVLDLLLDRLAADGYRTVTAHDLVTTYQPVMSMARERMRQT
ncbi:polysaccharide deacetylase family protein [Oerskovia sp. NPDC057915]|uniref:polysaccharide deacetylase family protein n=1 Tax=Oerskovia sp. NPDC057915 TaxID=3346280 RepID=UPI0036D969D9